MRMLAGLIAPSRGLVTIDGIRMERSSGSALRGRIGFLTETPGLWDRLSVRENLQIYAGLYSLARPGRVVDTALDTFGLQSYASSRAAELSKGSARRWRSRARCCTSRECCCSTSPPRDSIPR